jgi:CO dehydrogenase nickel-insertion accessory protein CooC1
MEYLDQQEIQEKFGAYQRIAISVGCTAAELDQLVDDIRLFVAGRIRNLGGGCITIDSTSHMIVEPKLL